MTDSPKLFVYPFSEFSSDEIERHPSSWVCFEADTGGQSIAAFKVGLVRSNRDNLLQMLADLESIAWHGGAVSKNTIPSDECNIWIAESEEQHAPPEIVAISYGVINSGVWLHSEFVERDLGNQICEIVAGKRKRISIENC